MRKRKILSFLLASSLMSAWGAIGRRLEGDASLERCDGENPV